jgi:outer membrane protein OmpA-like peptidoglycan-associated protein
MKKTLFVLLALLLKFAVFSQEERMQSDNIADCLGATMIINPGTYATQFTGDIGIVRDLGAYPSLKEFPEKNGMWFSFVAPFDGRLTLDAEVASGFLQMIVFQNETKDICSDIYKGIAEIKRIVSVPNAPKVGLSLVVDQNTLYPLDLKKDESIMVFFQSNTKEKPTMNFTIKYESLNPDAVEFSDNGKTVDLRKDKEKPTFNIMVRDAETGAPVITDLNLSGTKFSSTMHNGSDFYFNLEKSGKIQIRCDAPGYFFHDREEPVSSTSDHELVIYMQPLGQGRSYQIEEIEFKPGTSEFMPSADTKLKRLKDFLALNSGVKIEIQGHVHDTGGEESFAAQKLSEGRAKRVYNYLVESGIDKKRLTYKGYGGSMPIYAKPKFAYEEQANRRVEIKIVD